MPIRLKSELTNRNWRSAAAEFKDKPRDWSGLERSMLDALKKLEEQADGFDASDTKGGQAILESVKAIAKLTEKIQKVCDSAKSHLQKMDKGLDEVEKAVRGAAKERQAATDALLKASNAKTYFKALFDNKDCLGLSSKDCMDVVKMAKLANESGLKTFMKNHDLPVDPVKDLCKDWFADVTNY